jgi:hypothetical protein
MASVEWLDPFKMTDLVRSMSKSAEMAKLTLIKWDSFTQ